MHLIVYQPQNLNSSNLFMSGYVRAAYKIIFFDFPFQRVVAYSFILHFGFSLFVKWNPEKPLTHFFCSLHFSHSCPQICTIIRLFGQGLSCILSCISPKKSPFLPQNGWFCLFSYLHCFSLVYQCFLHKHRPKSADKPACISLGYHHITFSKINSKCDRAFVAPPEFKSLMLRQSAVQRAFSSTLYRFFMQKTEFLSLTIS